MEQDKKERPRVIGFDILLIFILLGGMTFAIHIYNGTAGKSCEHNFECSLHCPNGSFNEKFINIYRGPLGGPDCREGLAAICENNRCIAYDVYGAKSKEDCEKIGEGFNEFLCYRALAEKQAETALCREIDYEENKSACYLEFSQILGDLRLCGKITDEKLRDACINGLIEAPPDYIEQTPFRGDCEKRPQYSVCLSFTDGYTWLVFEEIIETETGEVEGQKIEVGRGKDSDYYHILYTDYVKWVEK